MPRLSCCVSVCKGDPQTPTKDPSVTLIPFPKDGALADQWRAVSGLSPDFVIKPLTRICSKHFRSGKRSLNPDSEDYIPSVFEAPQQVTKKSYCMTCRKVTLNCPCKSKEESADDESEEETNGEVESEDEDEEDGVAAEEEMEPEEEEELDDGQLVDSEDDEWTPAAAAESKPRRSTRPRRKRRHASSSDSATGGSESESPPPKVVKPTKIPAKDKVSPGKKVTPAKEGSPVKQNGANGDEKVADGMDTPTVPVTPKRKPGRRPKLAKEATTGASDSPAGTDGDAGAGTGPGTPGASANNSAIKTNTPNNKGSVKKVNPNATPAPPNLQDAKLLEKIKEMEMEHSMKVEKLVKNSNLRVANLKEEHLQTVHRLKVGWELEKANLQSQIEYYKETLQERSMGEEPIVHVHPFNGGQPIIVLQAPPDPSVEENNCGGSGVQG